ncbi:MAG: hypothetical protein J0L55_14260 [Caulobacterales bacterium]|nr:hypothetical protein [Caulobacterales bacterium]
MRKKQLIYSALPIALLSGIATQVFAGENCLIDNPNLNNCKGAIKVTNEFVVNGAGPIIVDSGATQYTSSYSYASGAGTQFENHQIEASQININNDQYSYSHSGPVNYAPPAPVTSGCKLVQKVPCQGQWVVVGENYGQNGGQIITQNYAPASVYAQPIYTPPANYSIQPLAQPVYNIPNSFFTGGMNYGVGYPTMIGYNSGGGMYMSGGTRFSGVVNRSTTPLIPPSGKPKQPPPPPPTGCGGGGC